MNNQVKECFHDWIENLQKVRNLSDNTLISYKNDIEKFLIFSKDHFGESLSMSDLESMQISDFRSFLSFLRNQGIGTTSIARVISSLKSFPDLATNDGLVVIPLIKPVSLNSLITSISAVSKKNSITNNILTDIFIS